MNARGVTYMNGWSSFPGLANDLSRWCLPLSRPQGRLYILAGVDLWKMSLQHRVSVGWVLFLLFPLQTNWAVRQKLVSFIWQKRNYQKRSRALFVGLVKWEAKKNVNTYTHQCVKSLCAQLYDILTQYICDVKVGTQLTRDNLITL